MHRVAVSVLSILIMLSQTAVAANCPANMQVRTAIELYFGRNVGEVLGVSEEAWSKFLDEEITPRFPDGLTVITIDGQWQDKGSGRIVREPGKLLSLIVEPNAAAMAKVSEIIAFYKVRHKQQSVLMTQREICALF
jgi:Protein of unknown function (DUF3574)